MNRFKRVSLIVSIYLRSDIVNFASVLISISYILDLTKLIIMPMRETEMWESSDSEVPETPPESVGSPSDDSMDLPQVESDRRNISSMMFLMPNGHYVSIFGVELLIV